MNPLRFFIGIVALLALLASSGVGAQVSRPIPPEASYGVMGDMGAGELGIGDYVYRLAPGLQIRGPDNLIVLPDQLRSLSRGLKVRYLADMHGDLIRVWILSDREIAGLKGMSLPPQPRPQPASPAFPRLGRPGSLGAY